MKKKHITIAGIVAAILLTIMFVGICLYSPSFPFLPAATTIDPITETSVDNNNMLILTGTTTLPLGTFLFISVMADPATLRQDDNTGRTKTGSSIVLTSGDWGRNRWKGQVDISELRPADYTVSLMTATMGENFTVKFSDPVATARFTLGEGTSAPEGIHKRGRVMIPFIRINTGDQPTVAGGLKVTGTTSLAPGTSLAWNMQGIPNGTGGSQDYTGTTAVIMGIDGINRWAVLPAVAIPGSARYQFTITGKPSGGDPGVQPVSATADIGTGSGPASLANTTGMPQGPCFITIDALPDIRADNVYILTGTTSLSPGEDLLVEVYPVSFETNYNFSLEGSEAKENRTLSGSAVFGGATGTANVVNGGGGENLWSFRLETYQISGGEYRINVSNNRYDYDTKTLVNGDLYSTRIFSIRG